MENCIVIGQPGVSPFSDEIIDVEIIAALPDFDDLEDEFEEDDFDDDFDDDFEEEMDEEYQVDNEEFPASDFDDGSGDFDSKDEFDRPEDKDANKEEED